MKLEGKFYVQVFCGNLSFGYILEKFEGEKLYVVELYDTDSYENAGCTKLLPFNDMIVGGYVFFDEHKNAVKFMDDIKVKIEEQKQQQKEEEV